MNSAPQMMHTNSANNDPVQIFKNEMRQWEHAISCYNGQDPLDLWFQFICWLEQSSNKDLENSFRKSLEHCLSLYEKFENYKQDLRMVKLWIKYIDFQENPSNLYQILYQQGVGTSSSAFYIGWAHYFNSANAFKQAESIFNLGLQLKAEPIADLEAAHKKFRYSVAQRMLYDDKSSNKRTISSLAEQRQQITTLSPHQQQSKRMKTEGNTEFSAQELNTEHQYFKSELQQPEPYYSPQPGSSSSSVHQDTPGYSIATSLSYVYDEDQTGYQIDPHFNHIEPVDLVPEITFEHGFQYPLHFISEARNNKTDQWRAPLCLEEPYDQNKKCFYPKHVVYPGDGKEYCLEEIRAKKFHEMAEEKLRLAEIARKEEEDRHRREQEAIEWKKRQVEQTKRQQEQAKRLQEQNYQQMQAQYQSAYHNQNYHHSPVQQQYHQSPNNYYSQQSYPQNMHQQQKMYDQNYDHHRMMDPNQMHYSHDHQYVQNQMYSQQMMTSTDTSQHQYVEPGYQMQPPDQMHSQNLQSHNSSQQSVIVNNQQYQTYEEYHVAVPQSSQDQIYDNYQVLAQGGEIDTDCLIIEEQEESSYDGEEYEENSEELTTVEVPKSKIIDENDFDEQIEASTISFCSTTNGTSTNKKITIKFRKEKADTSYAGANSESNSRSSSPTPAYHDQFSPKNTTIGKKKKKSKYRSNYDSENATFMPSNNNSCSSSQYVSNKDDEPANGEDAELLLSFSTIKAKDNRKMQKAAMCKDYTDDSISNSEFNNSFDPSAQNNFNHNFGSTPIRSAVSKTSTPHSSYKFLKKLTSNTSFLNDDSMCSYTGEQNSFFNAENDEDLRQRRQEKAIKTIEEHFAKKDIDPFSSELCRALLVKLNFPSRDNVTDYKIVNHNLGKLQKNHTATLGGISYHIEKEVGRGAYGAVYRGINTNDGSVVALKYQKPPNSWELYVCTEVKKRLRNNDILTGFMSISSAVIAPNASVLISEFSQFGSLLDINNKMRQATTKVMNESLVMHFSSQILDIVDHLHSCKIIHADIKPDNFLLMSIPSADSHVPSLRLIDFGCAIDMTLFSPKIESFRKIIQTDGFTCIEMQEGRSWSYQTDLFCVAGTIHVMLFGEYMQVNKKFNNAWEIKQKFPRYLKKHVWSEIFSKLLNIKDNKHLPNLRDMRSLINSELYNMDNELNRQIRTLGNLMKQR